MNKTDKASTRKRVAKLMRSRGWNHDRNTVRARAHALVERSWPWWDWGHPLMVITGDNTTGNWSECEPETWWYRLGQPKRMPITGYPRHPLSTLEVVKDYSEFRDLTLGMTDDEIADAGWKAICGSQDGDLYLGRMYWGGSFHGMTRWEMRLLTRYLNRHRRRGWFGAREWLYSLGLHGAVNRKKPFTCQAVPARGSGGYQHWFCAQKRRHLGPHRFGNYEWIGTLPVRPTQGDT